MNATTPVNGWTAEDHREFNKFALKHGIISMDSTFGYTPSEARAALETIARRADETLHAFGPDFLYAKPRKH